MRKRQKDTLIPTTDKWMVKLMVRTERVNSSGFNEREESFQVYFHLEMASGLCAANRENKTLIQVLMARMTFLLQKWLEIFREVKHEVEVVTFFVFYEVGSHC